MTFPAGKIVNACRSPHQLTFQYDARGGHAPPGAPGWFRFCRGKIVASFLLGTRRLYDFADDNPQVMMLDVAYVNDTAIIRRNPKVTAINSAIEIDLTGQVVADSIGTRQYSGVGGQMDFIRGASLSPGGKAMIALPSATSRGEPRIVPVLRPGAGVVTTRAHVHWVVTEHGAVNLYGLNLRQRARKLIGIAHPDHREALERAASGRRASGSAASRGGRAYGSAIDGRFVQKKMANRFSKT